MFSMPLTMEPTPCQRSSIEDAARQGTMRDETLAFDGSAGNVNSRVKAGTYANSPTQKEIYASANMDAAIQISNPAKGDVFQPKFTISRRQNVVDVLRNLQALKTLNPPRPNSCKNSNSFKCESEERIKNTQQQTKRHKKDFDRIIMIQTNADQKTQLQASQKPIGRQRGTSVQRQPNSAISGKDTSVLRQPSRHFKINLESKYRNQKNSTLSPSDRAAAQQLLNLIKSPQSQPNRQGSLPPADQNSDIRIPLNLLIQANALRENADAPCAETVLNPNSVKSRSRKPCSEPSVASVENAQSRNSHGPTALGQATGCTLMKQPESVENTERKTLKNTYDNQFNEAFPAAGAETSSQQHLLNISKSFRNKKEKSILLYQTAEEPPMASPDSPKHNDSANQNPLTQSMQDENTLTQSQNDDKLLSNMQSLENVIQNDDQNKIIINQNEFMAAEAEANFPDQESNIQVKRVQQPYQIKIETQNSNSPPPQNYQEHQLIPNSFIYKQDKMTKMKVLNQTIDPKYKIDPRSTLHELQNSKDIQMVKSVKLLAKTVNGFREPKLAGPKVQQKQKIQVSRQNFVLATEKPSELAREQNNTNQSFGEPGFDTSQFKQVGGQIYKMDKNNDLAKYKLMEQIIQRSRLKQSKSQSRGGNRFNFSTRVVDNEKLKQNIGKRNNDPYNEAKQDLRRCSLSPVSQKTSEVANLQKVFQCSQIKTLYESRKLEQQSSSFISDFPGFDNYEGKLIKELQDLLEQQSAGAEIQRSLNAASIAPSGANAAAADQKHKAQRSGMAGAQANAPKSLQNLSMKLQNQVRKDADIKKIETLLAESPGFRQKILRERQKASLANSEADQNSVRLIPSENIRLIYNKKQSNTSISVLNNTKSNRKSASNASSSNSLAHYQMKLNQLPSPDYDSTSHINISSTNGAQESRRSNPGRNLFGAQAHSSQPNFLSEKNQINIFKSSILDPCSKQSNFQDANAMPTPSSTVGDKTPATGPTQPPAQVDYFMPEVQTGTYTFKLSQKSKFFQRSNLEVLPEQNPYQTPDQNQRQNNDIINVYSKKITNTADAPIKVLRQKLHNRKASQNVESGPADAAEDKELLREQALQQSVGPAISSTKPDYLTKGGVQNQEMAGAQYASASLNSSLISEATQRRRLSKYQMMNLQTLDADQNRLLQTSKVPKLPGNPGQQLGQGSGNYRVVSQTHMNWKNVKKHEEGKLSSGQFDQSFAVKRVGLAYFDLFNRS